MAKDPRQLRHGEKHFPLITSEKGRDRANAYRAIEGLNQNDQIIYVLRDQANLMSEQNQMLRYMCDILHSIHVDVNAIRTGPDSADDGPGAAEAGELSSPASPDAHGGHPTDEPASR